MMVNGLLSELNESELKHLGEEIRNRIQRTEAQAAVLKFLQFAETTRDAVELKQRRVCVTEFQFHQLLHPSQCSTSIVLKMYI